jgi:hypothetical protein
VEIKLRDQLLPEGSKLDKNDVKCLPRSGAMKMLIVRVYEIPFRSTRPNRLHHRISIHAQSMHG